MAAIVTFLPSPNECLTNRGDHLCCARLPFVYMLSPLPRHRDWGHNFALSPRTISLPRNDDRVGLRDDLFEVCSVFTHVTACTLAGSPKVIYYIEGFSYFVTSITAPIASGWSEIAGWVSHPLGKRHLCTAHVVLDHLSRLLGNHRTQCSSD